MPGDQTRAVVLLYVHALLGEGVAAYLTRETGIPVRAVPALDVTAVADALADRPRVVIFERAAGVGLEELARSAPDAVLLDVSDAVSAGASPSGGTTTPDLEALVHAVAGPPPSHSHAC